MHAWLVIPPTTGIKERKQQELTGIEGRSWVLIAGRTVGRRELDGVQEKTLGMLVMRKDRSKVSPILISLNFKPVKTS